VIKENMFKGLERARRIAGNRIFLKHHGQGGKKKKELGTVGGGAKDEQGGQQHSGLNR